MPRQRLPPIVLEPSDQADHTPTIPGLPEEASEESSGEYAVEPSGPMRRASNVHHLPRPNLPPPNLRVPNLRTPNLQTPNLRTPNLNSPRHISPSGRSPLDLSPVGMTDPGSEPGVSGMVQVKLGGPGDLLRPSTLNIPIHGSSHSGRSMDEPDPTVIPGRRIEIMPVPPIPKENVGELEEPLAMAEAEAEDTGSVQAEAEESADDLEMDAEDIPSSDAPGADFASRAGRYDESAHPWLRQPRSSGIPDWAPLSAIAIWAAVSVMALADRFF